MLTLRCFVLSLLVSSLSSQPDTKVLVITDAEGVAGVCRQELTETSSSELRQLLTGEINAAVRGFLTAGAGEVHVWDGHGGSATLSALTIHPDAKLVMGALSPTLLMERKYSAVAFVGQHARANRSAAVMAHSYSSLGIQRILLNGQPVGEIETRSALAGWFGTPVIFLSGDQAAADDVKAIVPEAEVAVVKEGLGYYSCISLSASAAQELIEEKAQLAFQKLTQIPPYKITGPVSIQVERTTRSTLPVESKGEPGVVRVDPRTERYEGRDFLEAWLRWRR